MPDTVRQQSEAQKMNWGSVEKARERERQATRNRSKEIKTELERNYGVTDVPREKVKADRRKARGFKSDISDYGGWSSSPRRVKG